MSWRAGAPPRAREVMAAAATHRGSPTALGASVSVLVWRNRALGDAILSIPALRALRAARPRAVVRLVGYPDAWRVVAGLVDDALPIEAPVFAGLFAGGPAGELRTWLRDAERAVAVTTRDFGAVLRAAGVPNVVQISPYPPPGIHASDWLLRAVGMALDGDASDELRTARAEPPALALTESETARARRHLDGLGLERPVVLHPGAGQPWKRWPPDRYARLGDVLRQRGWQVALSAGPADGMATVEVQRTAREPFPVLGPLPPRDLAAALSLAACYVGNDSGVTHLAAAAGTPTLALFGPTDPASWAPRGNAWILRTCETRVEQQGQIRVCDDPHCLDGIMVEMVLDSVMAHIGQAPPA